MSHGSLSLSANAIVILVLAMTLLGLGIAFVNDVFGSLTSTTLEVTESARETILESLRRGDTRLAMPQTKVEVPKSGQEIFGFGIRNLDNKNSWYQVIIRNDAGIAMPATGGCDASFCFTYTGGSCSISNPPTAIPLNLCPGAKELGSQQDEIVSVLVKPKDTSVTGTKIYTLQVYKIYHTGATSTDIANYYSIVGSIHTPKLVYAQKDFFVAVN